MHPTRRSPQWSISTRGLVSVLLSAACPCACAQRGVAIRGAALLDSRYVPRWSSWFLSRPELATSVDKPPQGVDSRGQARRPPDHARGGAWQCSRLHRNGHDWSDRYPGIIDAARKLPCRTAIVDGEVIVQ